MTPTPSHVDTDELIETLERLERERLTMTHGFDTGSSFLRHLPALISALKEMREALSDATEAIIMMSGSSDFASDGQAGSWWVKFRDEKFYPAILPLTLQPQGVKTNA